MATTPVPEPRPTASGGRRFFLQRTLGEGAFGVVYLADMEGQGGFRRQVALKVLNANWDPASDAGRRLRDEARLLGRLQHRHIVRVDDLVQLDGRWALVMEYIDGADLEVVYTLCKAQSRVLPARAVAEVGLAVAAALGAAWTAPGPDQQPLRVIHRDIKPSNVRVSGKGDIKVLDFGVARAEFEGREAKTERVRYGSLGYMSPERLLGEPELPGGDVYALGVLIFELLTLDTYGRAELAAEKQAEQIERADALLAMALGSHGEGLRALVRRCLAYKVDDRPSPMELESALRGCLKDLPGDDIHTFVLDTFPALGIASPAGPDPVAGRVLEEHVTNVLDQAPRPYTTSGHTAPPSASGTLVLPDDASIDEPELPSAPRTGRTVGLAVAGVGLAAALAVGGWWWSGRADPVAPETTASTAPSPHAVATMSTPTAPAAAPEAAEPAPPPVATAEGTVTTPPTASAPAGTPLPARASPRATAPTPTANATPAPVTPTAAPAAAPEASAGPRLRAAKFTLTGAEGLQVTCGDVRGSGTTSALLRDFPAGTCTVTAGGQRTSLTVDSPRGISCVVEADALTCR